MRVWDEHQRRMEAATQRLRDRYTEARRAKHRPLPVVDEDGARARAVTASRAMGLRDAGHVIDLAVDAASAAIAAGVPLSALYDLVGSAYCAGRPIQQPTTSERDDEDDE